MYSLAAPNTACDIQSGHRTDNAKQKLKKEDLKIIKVNDLGGADQLDSDPLDPSEIAAKILQMHAAADEPIPAETRRPVLLNGHDEPALDIPGVLRRPKLDAGHKRPEPDPVPAPQSGWDGFKPTENGPSFKALLVSTALIVSIGAGALAFGLIGYSKDNDQGERLVETEEITTIESLIAENAAEDSASPVEADPPATTAQIEKAKDRVRQAFSARKTGTVAPVDPTRPLNREALNSSAPQLQLSPPLHTSRPQPIEVTANRIAEPDPALAGTTLNMPVTAALPSLGEPAHSAKEAEIQTKVSARATEESRTATEESGANTAEQSYPNSGTVTASVNLRQSQDKDATVLGVIPEGTQVRYNDCGTWWCGVSHNGMTGFVGQKYLDRPAGAE